MIWWESLIYDALWLALTALQDPLGAWIKGRIILVGDAAHPMLPTQGQGASQSIEDAEALGAFFEDVREVPSRGQLDYIFKVTHYPTTQMCKFTNPEHDSEFSSHAMRESALFRKAVNRQLNPVQ